SLGRVPARLAGRLLTSPLAFVLGGVLDTVRFLTAVAGDRRRRLRATPTIATRAHPTDVDPLWAP
ncbi:MAG: hypothetical protein M3022_02365, partial [Actinomycetota bacterium]|nr:hypothetical protein [Actinomycetota bacterium]